MQKGLLFFVLVCCFSAAVSQNACGIINSYYKVNFIDTCNNLMYVSAKGLQKGDRVVIMQMNGAAVQLNNNSSFGSVTALNESGNYEFNVINNVISDTQISFSLKLLNAYNPANALQIIQFPAFRNVNITCPLTCKGWNGQTGGVLVLFATDTIRIQSTITVTGKGFRGSLPINAGNCQPVPYTNYFTTALANLAGRKGEGVAIMDLAYECGRGKAANAGGGGNEHNSGGGGGSNYGTGGDGGDRIKNILSCPGNYPGLGGESLAAYYSNKPKNKLFMGGSGGCGHENNNYSDTSGIGGGIAIIVSNIIKCNNDTVFANGENVVGYGAEDGGSGGGGGGVIVLKADSVYGKIILSVKGGFGQSVDNSAKNECYGPGGGGGAGVICMSSKFKVSNIICDTTGGKAGIDYNATGACNNTSNTATNGLSGHAIINYVYNENPIIFRKFTVNSGSDLTICSGETTQLGVNQGASFEWSPNYKLSDYRSKNPKASPDTTTTYIVKAFDSCSYAYDTVTVFVIPSPIITHTHDTAICYGDTLQLFVTGASSFTWSPPISINNTGIANPKVWPSTTRKYAVKATNGNCSVSDSVLVTVVQAPVIKVNKDTLMCLGDKMILHASGATTYEWSPDSNISNIHIADPEITAVKTITYYVKAYNVGGCFGTNKVTITVDSCKKIPKEVKETLVIIPNVFTPNNDGVNDYFEIYSKNISDFSIVIFNRWGQVIFSSDDAHFKWDASGLGDGVYFYKIAYKDVDLKEFNTKGPLTLIR